MKIISWGALVTLVLISLLNVGAVTGSDPLAVVVLAVLLGLVGFVAAVGLFRRTVWGRPAAVAVAAINVVGAIVDLAYDSGGAVIALVISAIALSLSFFARDAPASRKHPEASLI